MSWGQHTWHMTFGQHLDSKQHPLYFITHTYKKSHYCVFILFEFYHFSLHPLVLSLSQESFLVYCTTVSIHRELLLTKSLREVVFFLPVSFPQSLPHHSKQDVQGCCTLVVHYFLSSFSPLFTQLYSLVFEHIYCLGSSFLGCLFALFFPFI